MGTPPRNDRRISSFNGLRRLLVMIGAAVLVIPACGNGDTTTTTGPTAASTAPVATATTSEPVTTVTPASTTTVITTTSIDTEVTGQTVYFLLEELDVDDGSPGPYLVPVYREAPVAENAAETALRLLLEGPTTDETAGIPPISTAIPDVVSTINQASMGRLKRNSEPRRCR